MYQGSPEIVLATAPDPVHTHGALLFDRSIDAIEDALQDSGWDYQGSWMPWSVASEKPEDGTIEDAEEERLFKSGREQYPGVILFRASQGHIRRRPLLVFVIGDSPTTGVVGSQFREALAVFLTLSSSTAPLEILGPDFTGAEPSFYTLLQNARDVNGDPFLTSWHSVSVASGTISDSQCDHVLPGIQPSPSDPSDCGHGPHQFVSFGVDSKWELQETWSFLKQYGVSDNEIAELSEDESGFGELLSHSSISPAHESRGSKTGEPQVDRILHVKFPRGIAHLRKAYQKNAIWGFGASTTAGNLNLSLDFDEPQEANDSVAAFAQEELAVSQEASMGQLAEILEERQIKAVLVSASDVLDELFVTQFLARHVPNVMVILRGTDNLFLRSGDGGMSRNTYAISPWPLIPANTTWTSRPIDTESPRSFPSGDAEGVYTAMRYLVGEHTEKLRDYRSPVGAANPSGAPRVADAIPSRPPLWFSLVSRGAFWPVASLDDVHSDPSVRRSAINLPVLNQESITSVASVPASPLSQRLILLVGVALSLLHAGKCLRLRLLERIAPWYDSYDANARYPKFVLQLGISLLGIVLLCLTYEPPIKSNLINHVWQEIPWVFFIIAIAALSLAAIHSCWLIWQKPGNTSGTPANLTLKMRVLVILPIVILGCLAIWVGIWAWLIGGEPRDGMAMFFGFRSRHPLSGASPVFPVFLALNGVILILLSRLSLLNFSPSMAPRVPDSVPPYFHCPSANATWEIDRLLTWPIAGKTILQKAKTINVKFQIVIIIALCVPFIAFSLNIVPRMLEAARIRWLLSATLCLLVVAMLSDLAIAAVIWNRLRAGCLLPLESSTLRRGFNAISGLTWKSLWLMPQTANVQYRAITRSLEQSSRKIMDRWADDPTSGESLREATKEMWIDYSEGHQQAAITMFGVVQDRLASAGQRVLLCLHELWKKEVELVTAPDQFEKPSTTLVSQPNSSRLVAILEEWLALMYVHYIRLVLIQIRTRMATAAMLYILLVWTITSYPFINRHALTVGLSGLLAILATIVITTYASINRDPILSRTINEKPGRLDIDFLWKTASMVGIPVLGLIASQFPEVSNFLFSWIEPGLNSAK
jgi:hypothetical protein